MWQVAVYRPTQHEQFRTSRRNIKLRYDSTGERWQLDEVGEANDGVLMLRVSATGDTLVVDCRGRCGSIELASGSAFNCGVPIELAVPCLFRLDDDWFEVRAEPSASEETNLEPLDLPAVDVTSVMPPSPANPPAGPGAKTVRDWLAAAGELHRTAASAPEFFDNAARLALQGTGLDAVMVLRRDGDDWLIAGSDVPHPEEGISFESPVLEQLEECPVVWRRTAPALQANTTETAPHDAIVVAPIVDDSGELIAALYGVRHCRQANRRRGIRTLEARVIELMADAVAVGMARRQQEFESARRQVLLEQAFSPAVADHLRRHPEALAGAERDVTLLFADLRGFTPLAENLSPSDAYELLAAVMEMLTQAIMDHQGVVIDYFGDGVSALWNAPLDVPDHADLACTAALQMLESLPAVSSQWQRLLSAPLELGIGIHAAKVQVGNAGTRRRLKYGPRGSGVNVASRVQAAAKHLDVALLATDAVRRRLSSRFVTLKVCTARLPGLEESLDLFTLYPSTDGQRLQRDLDRYAAALEAFESGDLDAAEQVLTSLLAAGPATPAAFLAQQTAALRQAAMGRRSTDQIGCSPDAVIEILAK